MCGDAKPSYNSSTTAMLETQYRPDKAMLTRSKFQARVFLVLNRIAASDGAMVGQETNSAVQRDARRQAVPSASQKSRKIGGMIGQCRGLIIGAYDARDREKPYADR
jgi:surface antigen